MDMLTTLKNIKFFYELYKTIPFVKVRHILNTPLRHVKLADEYFRREISAGDIVTVSGYLSKYCQYFKPISYAPMVYAPSVEETKMSFDRFGNDPMLSTSLQMGPMKKTIVPMQALPEYTGDEGKFRIAFLYPDDFAGFLKSGNIAPQTQVEDTHKAIPVLLKEKDFQKLTEQYVKITAMLSFLPQEANDAFSSAQIDQDVQSMMYLHFRPTSELIGFTLDCREVLESTVYKRELSVHAGVYVEGHFEKGPDDMHKYDFGGIINGMTASTPLRLGEGAMSYRIYGMAPERDVYIDEIEQGFTRHYLRNDYINILQKDNVISFYTEFNIHDDRDADASLSRLNATYMDTWRNIKKYLAKNKYPEASFELDFLWDYRRAGYFHKKGVLRSEESASVFKSNTDLATTMEWLKS